MQSSFSKVTSDLQRPHSNSVPWLPWDQGVLPSFGGLHSGSTPCAKKEPHELCLEVSSHFSISLCYLSSAVPYASSKSCMNIPFVVLCSVIWHWVIDRKDTVCWGRGSRSRWITTGYFKTRWQKDRNGLDFCVSCVEIEDFREATCEMEKNVDTRVKTPLSVC